jgi:STE24 endopeptidase
MLLTIVVLIVLLVFVIESTLDYLNQSRAYAPVPQEIADLYKLDERDRSIAYGSEKYRLGLLSSAISTALLILALTQGWLASLDNWVRGITSQPILISLIFIAALSAISWAIDLPFGLYSIFSIEARYGFNKVTAKTFLSDLVKGTLVSVAIGGPMLALVIWLYQTFTDRFWLYGWLVIALFSLVMFMFGTRVILPLFNKLTPLADGELKTAIDDYCQTQGYSLTRLFVMDGSKRSTKANAFFSGLGKSKTIVLFDTLIEKLSTKEIVAVLAHEIGHYRRKHTLVMFIASNLQSLAIFALFGWALSYDRLSTSLGAQQPSFHLSAITFFILLGPLQVALGLLNNSLSRRNEYDADQFAVETYSSKPLASGLRKISKDSLANLTPHPWYVAFHYTHPPLALRLEALKIAEK